MSRPPGQGGPASPPLASSVALVAELQRALTAGDRARTVDCLARLIAGRAPMGPQWQQLAQIAAELGEIGLALHAIDLFVAASGEAPSARYMKAGLLARIGGVAEAYALLSALPEDLPQPAVNAYSRGAAAVFLGLRDEARALLERALSLDPQLGQAWLPLSTLVDFAAEPALARQIAAAGRALEQAPPPARTAHFYALGKAYADLGEPALAFAAFERGGQVAKGAQAYDRDADRASAEEAVRGYTAEAIADIARRQDQDTARTIFVTGLPRSGTTLVEQILTSHSAVSDGAEINRLGLLARELGGPSFGALAGHVAAHGAGPAAQLWNHWMDQRFPGPGRAVDKSIGSSRYLGLAAALLADAPVVWLTRDPLDCAWSCFRTHFLAGVPWSCDLADIAFHFRLEDRLLPQWQALLGERLLVVPYEALVGDPERWIRRLLAHCGLAEEPQVFAPQDNRRPVMTMSTMQVRRPIHRDAIDSAAAYRPFLEPFLRAYRD